MKIKELLQLCRPTKFMRLLFNTDWNPCWDEKYQLINLNSNRGILQRKVKKN